MTVPRASPRAGRTRDLALVAEQARERLLVSMDEMGVTRLPVTVPIVEVEREADGIATLWVEVDVSIALDTRPGRFWMLWDPYDEHGRLDRRHHVSEKPYSVGDIDLDHLPDDPFMGGGTGRSGVARLGFTVKDLGRQSGTLIRLEVGDWLGLKGPFGTTFPFPAAGEHLLLVSGGIGSTPLHLAAWEARRLLGGCLHITAIMGFQSEAGAHYVERMREVCDTVHIATDDGSLGHHGFPTDLVPAALAEGASRILTCGPEIMMQRVLDLAAAASIPAAASMERYLPCGVAVCGLCMVGDRLTCQEGPVLPGDWLLEQADFGTPQAH